MLRQFIKSIIDGVIQIEYLFFTRKARRQKSVLIFRKDGLGDYILFYPFLKYFRAYYKDYKITLVVPKVANGLTPLLKNFDEIIEFDAKQFSNNFFYRRSFIKNLARRGYEIAIYPAYSREPIGDMIIRLTGATKKIGIKTTGDNSTYTDLIEIPQTTTSEIHRNRHFAEQCTRQKIALSLPTIDIALFDDTLARELMRTHHLIPKKFCVVFAGAGAEYRKWPEERFSAMCDYLSSHDIIPVVCGGPDDKNTARQIVSKSAHPERIVNLAGATDISALAHILHASLFYFGNDTGALHLAAALNVPVVCLLGGGGFERFFPYGDHEQNLSVFDEHMKCKNDGWDCAKECRGDERAPCIMGITLENAKKVVDTMLVRLNNRR